MSGSSWAVRQVATGSGGSLTTINLLSGWSLSDGAGWSTGGTSFTLVLSGGSVDRAWAVRLGNLRSGGTLRSSVLVATVRGSLNGMRSARSLISHWSAWSLIWVRGSAWSSLMVWTRWPGRSLEAIVLTIAVRHMGARGLLPGGSRDSNKCSDGVLVQHDFVVDFTILHLIHSGSI